MHEADRSSEVRRHNTPQAAGMAMPPSCASTGTKSPEQDGRPCLSCQATANTAPVRARRETSQPHVAFPPCCSGPHNAACASGPGPVPLQVSQASRARTPSLQQAASSLKHTPSLADQDRHPGVSRRSRSSSPRKREWYDAVTAHWASHKGLAVAANKNKSPFNGAWSKLYFNQKLCDPTVVNLDNGKVVTYQEVSHAAKALWRAAKAKLADLNETPIPSGTPPCGGG